MLTSATLLQAWRLRWRRAMGRELRAPFAEGRWASWIDRQRRAPFWHMPWPSRLAVVLCLGFVLLTPTVGLAPSAQLLFAALQIFFAVLLCRYASPVFPVAVLSLSVMATSRYLVWRLTDTLPLSGVDWFWGLLLWLTELLAALAWTLRMVEHHAPLARDVPPLPEAAVTWPTVDVIFWCAQPNDAQAQAALQRQLQATRSWDWPGNKLRLHVISPRPNADVGDDASERFKQCLAPWGAQWHGTESLTTYLQSAEAYANLPSELLLLVEGPGDLPADVLQGGVPALVQNLGLAYVCTPNARLAPQTWAYAPVQGHVHLAPLTLARRSALQAVLKGQTKWTVGGWMTPDMRWVDETDAADRWRVCEVAARPAALRWRLRARATVQALRFYAPLAWTVVAITPLLALGLGWAPVRTDGLSLFAYAIPHGWIASMAWRAQDRQGRYTSARLLREWALQAAVMWRTARAYTKTQLRYVIGLVVPAWAPRWPNPSLPLWLWARELALLVSHSVLLVALLWNAPSWAVWSGSLLGLYVVWAAYNLVNTLARLGVAKEAALVERETQARAKQEAVLTLGPRRVLRVSTENFPEPTLRLRWLHAPDGVPATNARLTVSVFHKGVAHSFSGQGEAWDDAGLTLRIAAEDLADYQAFGAAVFSRDADWPMWLAERHADQLLPNIMHRLYKWVESVFYDFVIARRGVQTLLQLWRGWTRPGSPDHG